MAASNAIKSAGKLGGLIIFFRNFIVQQVNHYSYGWLERCSQEMDFHVSGL